MSRRQLTGERGIRVIHGRGCPGKTGGSCNCTATLEASIYDPVAKRGIFKGGFTTKSEARLWRQDAKQAIRAGTLRAPQPTTVGQAADQLLVGMADGSILSRSRRPYKPSTTRDYKRILDQYLLPALGDRKLTNISRADVEQLVDQLRKTGLAASTIHNILDPLRVIYRRARRRGEIAVDPTDDLELPAVKGRRERIEPPAVALELIATLPEPERAFWTCAFFTGLRRGELRGLDWTSIDLTENVINVQWGWDPVEGRIDVKSTAGERTVPIAGLVRKTLIQHKLRTGRDGTDLVFGRSATEPFYPSTIRARALTAWGWRQVTRNRRTTWEKARNDALEPLTPHEARHCAATYFLAAGWDWREVMEWIGHSDVRQTINRYAHTQKGAQKRAAEKLDTFLAPAMERESSR